MRSASPRPQTTAGPARGTQRSAPPVLPRQVGTFIKRRVLELVGGAMALFGLFILASCLTFHAQDPSLNTITDYHAENLFGFFGSVVADLGLQLAGLAVFPAALVMIIWGIIIVRRHRLGTVAWLFVLAAAILLLGLGLAQIPVQSTVWPFPEPGLGGWIGKWLAAILVTDMPFAGAVFLAGAGVALFGLCLGLRPRAVLAFAFWWWNAVPRRPLPLEATQSQKKDHRHAAHKPLRATRRPPTFTNEPSQNSGFSAPESELEVKPLNRTAVSDKKAQEVQQARLALGPTPLFDLPSLSLLNMAAKKNSDHAFRREALTKNARLLEEVLREFGIKGKIVIVRPGPVVTRYDFKPAPGTKNSRIVNLADDIARSLSAVAVRIAVVTGSDVIGIELPNRQRQTVQLSELLASTTAEHSGAHLPLALGKDIGGETFISDLTQMPHLLIAGTTGSGKSVALNAMVLSLLFTRTPEQVRLLLIDPKMLEFFVYQDIPHLLTPVVVEPKKAIIALKWAVREMEERYLAMAEVGVRSIRDYNTRLEQDPGAGENLHVATASAGGLLPYIVIVVDEMADLMMTAGKQVEIVVQRLAQMARAAGIHLIMATQRPSVDVITGTIKANFPTRISFHVTTRIDSRTIIGESGAEQLLGRGDMLFMAGGGRLTRLHGPWVSSQEVESVVEYLKNQAPPQYQQQVLSSQESEGESENPDEDDLYSQACAVIFKQGKASTSMLQRYLKIGYNRAAGLIDQMEAEGIVSCADHVGRRRVLRTEK